MRKIICLLLGILMCCMVCACEFIPGEKLSGEEKKSDLGFTVVGEDALPEELHSLIDEKKNEAFQFTFSDKTYLYIVVGYGKQAQGGYSIAVDECYLTDTAIKVKTTLLGPSKETRVENAESYPYIVLKMDYLDKPVEF